MDWRSTVAFPLLYAAGYFAHAEPERISFTFRAPSALTLLCGRPLGKNKLEFSPMVAQLVGLTGLVVPLMEPVGLIAHRTSLRIRAWSLLTWMLCTVIAALPHIAKGQK